MMCWWRGKEGREARAKSLVDFSMSPHFGGDVDLGPDLARVTHLDASFLREGTGMCFGGQTELRKWRVCSLPNWGQTLPGCHTWVQVSGGRDRDVFRRADRTQKMARVLNPGLGPDLARVAHLDASFLGKGCGLDRLLVWGGFPKGGCLW